MVEVYVISAFSKDGRGGNKAGVVLDSRDLMPAKMMAIAKDLGYSDTNIKLKALILDRQSKRQNPILPTGSMFLLL